MHFALLTWSCLDCPSHQRLDRSPGCSNRSSGHSTRHSLHHSPRLFLDLFRELVLDLSSVACAARLGRPSIAWSQARLSLALRCLNGRFLIAWLATVAGICWPISSWAAGGHHAVDDASILDAGQCQVELWSEQASGRSLQHVGPACRVSGVELGLNLERSSLQNAPAMRSGGVQVKWAADLQPALAVGFVWSAGWQSTSPHFSGQTLLLPVTWSPREDLDLHVNVGRDLRPHAGDVERLGVALEWKPSAHWQTLVEWWRDAGGAQARAGLRYAFSDRLSVDLSRAESLRSAHKYWWTMGLNWAFDR